MFRIQIHLSSGKDLQLCFLTEAARAEVMADLGNRMGKPNEVFSFCAPGSPPTVSVLASAILVAKLGDRSE